MIRYIRNVVAIVLLRLIASAEICPSFVTYPAYTLICIWILVRVSPKSSILCIHWNLQ